MTEFNLSQLIREVVDTSTIADPAGLAKEVAKRIGRNQERVALEQALTPLVRVFLSQLRASTQHASGGQSSGDDQGIPAAGGSRSRKVASIRETWARMLRDRVSTGPDSTDWKFLADCTVEDLRYAEQIRRDHAAATLVSADRFAGLAELLVEHRVATVGQLPKPVLAETLADAA